MMNIYGFGPAEMVSFVLEYLINKKNIKEWLDLGCGNGEFLLEVSRNISDKIQITGVDIVKEVEDNFKLKNFRFIKSDSAIFLKRLNIKYDLISLFEIIEHIEKKNSVKMIIEAQNKSDNILLSTPNGFLRQDFETNPELINKNPYQVHKCGFLAEEIEKFGFFCFKIKNYHFRKNQKKKFFDALVCYWSRNNDYKNLQAYIKRRFFLKIFLDPLVVYRSLKAYTKPMIYRFYHEKRKRTS
ncbi:methyltransferase domain-containing protein [Desulfonauticus submarinus]